VLAAERKTTLTQVFEDALREAIDRAERPQPRDRIKLPKWEGTVPFELPAGVTAERIAHMFDDDLDDVVL
jgi:hypothetical protein